MMGTIQPALALTVRSGTISRLATLLQRGFLVPCSGPITLYDFLNTLPGFDREYIRSRVETIFINGCAADSLEDLLLPGSTVALSAAMPGLAGAIFRKGGVHASLRSRTAQDQPRQATTEGFVSLKLFNMIAADAAENLLTGGIFIKGPLLARFFDRQEERLHNLVVDIRQNTNSLTLTDARLLAQSHAVIQLKVSDIPGQL